MGGVANETHPLLAFATSWAMGTKVDLSPGYSSRSYDNYQLVLLFAASHPALLTACQNTPCTTVLFFQIHRRQLILWVSSAELCHQSSGCGLGSVAWGLESWGQGGKLEHGGPDEGFTRSVWTWDGPHLWSSGTIPCSWPPLNLWYKNSWI